MGGFDRTPDLFEKFLIVGCEERLSVLFLGQSCGFGSSVRLEIAMHELEINYIATIIN